MRKNKLVQSEPFNRHVSFFVISGFLDKSIYDMKVLNFPRKELSKSVQIDESLCCVCIIKQLRKEHSAARIDQTLHTQWLADLQKDDVSRTKVGSVSVLRGLQYFSSVFIFFSPNFGPQGAEKSFLFFQTKYQQV